MTNFEKLKEEIKETDIDTFAFLLRDFVCRKISIKHCDTHRCGNRCVKEWLEKEVN